MRRRLLLGWRVLADIPICLVLVGLCAYAVLAGADFGAGFWMLFPARGRVGPKAIADHARHAMGPVWEANHVWLIFVLVVAWTAYPRAFGSITSTLAVPLFIGALGIVLRGTAYAVRGQGEGTRLERPIERLFALSSILAPFALGTVIGAIAAGRVPVGNARGHEITSWFYPMPLVTGVLTVATSSYLAAVYLAADARRLGERPLELEFRRRALGAGLVTGGLAVVGLLVTRAEAPYLWHGLSSGGGLAAVCVSAVAGMATIALVWRSRFGPARASAALAVVALVVGFALAQEPRFLPGLTIHQAAAGHSTLVAIVIAVAIGAVVLIPSLVFLFGLFLRGRFDPGAELPAEALAPSVAREGSRLWRVIRAPLSVSSLLAGVGLMVFADAGWAHAVGILCLVAFALSAFAAATNASTLIETQDAGRGALRGGRGDPRPEGPAPP
jgi:cytochrome d ubiquinol oxidase subunit II